jgi:GxxExxY protein
MFRDDLLFKEEVHNIIGAAMAVHRYFGCGFTEKVYQDALEIELANQNIPSVREAELHIAYYGKELAATFKPDFICYNNIIVELKAVKELDDTHRSQAINYGKVAKCDLALLVNFGETSLKFERYVIKKKN